MALITKFTRALAVALWQWRLGGEGKRKDLGSKKPVFYFLNYFSPLLGATKGSWNICFRGYQSERKLNILERSGTKKLSLRKTITSNSRELQEAEQL